MSERITIKDAYASLARLAQATGNRLARPYNREQGYDVGGWALDYNPTYGGVVIIEYVNNGGGQSTPITSRMGLREFVDAVNFALRAFGGRR